MSELKVIKIELNNHGKPIASIQGTTSYYGISPNDTFYPKSEADKVIADKDAAIAELKEQVHDYAQGLYVIQARAEKEARHHKYKRCVAMAEWCKESLRLMRTYEVTDDYWNLEPGQDAEYFCKKGDFYSKWRKRWLALAEEPTWMKFLQLIRKEAK